MPPAWSPWENTHWSQSTHAYSVFPKLPHSSHLLLTQDDHPSRFNWVPGGQVVPGAKALPILVSLPEAVSGRPGDADVVPAAVAQGQRQLGHLCRAWGKRHQRNEEKTFGVFLPPAGPWVLIVARRKQGWQLEELHLQRDQRKAPDQPVRCRRFKLDRWHWGINHPSKTPGSYQPKRVLLSFLHLCTDQTKTISQWNHSPLRLPCSCEYVTH